MPGTLRETVFLLPERRRFAGQPLSPTMACRLGRADRLADAAPGEREQLLRYFDVLPHGWPLAAISRQFELGDAASSAWLRADPVHVRPDLGGARLLAWGNLQVSEAEAQAFVQALKPLFGDSGLPISAPSAERWYLQLSRETPVPAFATPADSLGEDLLGHLPSRPEGKRWRGLLNEAQILLHQHPLNATRIARGLLPVNSLWFWGAGVLPDVVRSRVRLLESDDFELRALAARVVEEDATSATPLRLVDLRSERNWTAVEAALVEDAMPWFCDFSDGARWCGVAGQGWRFWRRPLKALA